ncbi:hypothetical protein AVL62_12845 [Serinicoccus chungangensis]|uniref:beta-fructofuranosidase n=1 Tax=Serinicoccus chungangensis TaxID=767452 RepID=A0A0W8I0L1_9MICO|nr:glycoside hydrolase family 32 protein [Serinicoccus chungangensis]KUG51125.1 hypothetical protein AVL62_12845 [Serinicoccus chungangensis]
MTYRPDSAAGSAVTAYHLRPDSGWLNDPNGMVHRDGRWHVFFQHNPDAPRHDQIAWGHASSADLVSWRDHRVAFEPTPGGPDAAGCWSGVFVDGLERPAVVYSGVTGPDHASTVCLRWGEGEELDDWGAPLVVATTPDADDVAIMRDPFVLTHAGRRFALVGAGLRDGTPAILLYSCDDIEDWDYLGIWLTGAELPLEGALPADVWECPQLAVWGDRATLVLSLHDRGVLGEVVGCTGALVDDGGLPRLRVEQVQVLDEGTDFYAPQLAADDADGWWLMGWIRELDRDPSVRDHAGCMTLPRRLVPDGDGARLVLDPRVAGALEVEEATAGTSLRRARLVAGPGGGSLRHPELGSRPLAPGAVAYVDGEVLEVYPPAGPPATLRHTAAWEVEGDVDVSAVLTSSRAARAGTGAPRAEA